MRHAVLALLASGCATFPSLTGAPVAPKPPRITVGKIGLAAYPRPEVIARALCPRMAASPLCGLLGPTPRAAELRVAFAVDLEVTNDAEIAVPLVEALVAFTAYPDEGGGKLGAVCLAMCPDGANCPPRADACSAGGPGLRTASDYAAAAAGFLVGVATGQEAIENLRVRTLAPHQSSRVTVTLELAPEELLALIERFARASLGGVAQGRLPAISLPYALEGTAWVNVDHFGKIGAGFGPVRGTWTLE